MIRLKNSLSSGALLTLHAFLKILLFKSPHATVQFLIIIANRGLECRIEAINDLHILGALIISTSRSPLSRFSPSHLLPFFLMRFSLHIRLNSLLHFPSPPPLKHWVTRSWTPAAAREPVCSLRCRPLGPPFLDGCSPFPCPESRQLCLQSVWPVLSFYIFF